VRARGFTLLELMVATFILGVAVVALLSNISSSLRNAGRLTDHDRAALAAKRKMDELLLETRLPQPEVAEGPLQPSDSAGLQGGWRARRIPFEMPPQPGPGAAYLERVELEIWWMSGGSRRTLTLEGFRRGRMGAPGRAAGP